ILPGCLRGGGGGPRRARRRARPWRRARQVSETSRRSIVAQRCPVLVVVIQSAPGMPFDTPAPVLRHDALNRDHFLLTLECPDIAREARPGQFVMLQSRPGFEPLLRRPMSVCRILPGRRRRIQILYKVVGEGTRYLSRQPVGARVPTLGPLGNGFRLPPAGTRPLLVSGGVGIAIFPFLVEGLRAARRETPLLVYGARSRRDLVALDFFRRKKVPMRLATEDGSAGTRGFVTRILAPILDGARGAPMEI